MARYQVSQMIPWPGKLGLMESAAERRWNEKLRVESVKEITKWKMNSHGSQDATALSGIPTLDSLYCLCFG